MDTEYRRAANITIVVAGIIALGWLLLKYAIGALSPFIIAAIIAALIAPISKKIADKTKISRKLCPEIRHKKAFPEVGKCSKKNTRNSRKSLKYCRFYVSIHICDTLISLLTFACGPETKRR